MLEDRKDSTQIDTTYLEEMNALFLSFTFFVKNSRPDQVMHYFDCEKILDNEGRTLLRLEPIPDQLPDKNLNRIFNIGNKDCIVSESLGEEYDESSYSGDSNSEDLKKCNRMPVKPIYRNNVKIEEVCHIRDDQNIIKPVFFPVKLISFPIDNDSDKDNLEIEEVEEKNKVDSQRYETFACDRGFLKVLL